MTEIRPDVPEDFESFWTPVIAEAEGSPLDFQRKPQTTVEAFPHRVDHVTFRGVTGEPLFGWIAVPPETEPTASFLWLPPYGRESVMPNEYGTRIGFVSMSFNFHGEGAFHREAYVPDRGYFSHGADEPETFVFKRMLQNAVIASKVLQAQPECDIDRIGAMGMSQGGGISIWLGAWCPRIKAVCADMPFLSAMPWVFSQPVYRYPLKEVSDFMETIPVGRERVLHTLSYFDTLNMATRCSVPTQVSLGLKDPAVRPPTVKAVYEALPGPKRLIEYDWGHDWHPEMVGRNRDWLMTYL
ncbi:MAG: acetylxylan esterase [Fimbriimonadaceae bacterium]